MKFVRLVALLVVAFAAACSQSSPTAPTTVVTPPVATTPQPSAGAELIGRILGFTMNPAPTGNSGELINPISNATFEIILTVSQPVRILLRHNYAEVKEVSAPAGTSKVTIQVGATVDEIRFYNNSLSMATGKADIYLVR